jgi:hypothetical protein
MGALGRGTTYTRAYVCSVNGLGPKSLKDFEAYVGYEMI